MSMVRPRTHPSTRQRAPSSKRRDKTRLPQRALRLVLLLQELAACDSAGLTHKEMLARPAIQVLYNPSGSAASQALRRDLITLSGGVPHQQRQISTADAAPASTPGEPAPLLRYDTASGRYSLAFTSAPERLSTEALQALCLLASALHGGHKIPWGTDLFSQLCALLAPDQQSILTAAIHGRLPEQATPTLSLDLPDVEERDLDALRLLTRAIRQRQTIDFDYQRPHAAAPTEHRGDEVLEVWFDAHAYVAVWCEDAQRELDLRLDRILPGSLKIYARTATRHQQRGERIGYWLAPAIAQGGVSVRLAQQEVRHQADGSAIVSGIARSRFWARKLLLSYGSNARALWPAPLVEDMRRTVEEMGQLYEENGRQWEIEPPQQEEGKL